MTAEPSPPDGSASPAPPPLARHSATAWIAIGVGSLGLVVVAWCLLTAGSAIVHGHPAYWAVLFVTVVVSGLVVWRSARSGPAMPGRREPGQYVEDSRRGPGPTEPGPTEPGPTEPGPTEPGPTEPGTAGSGPQVPDSAAGRSRWRRVLRVAGLVALTAWILLTGWLRPFAAVEPALSAMQSDGAVTITEYPTQIVLTPKGTVSSTGVFFQPGARVDARAYAAVLRPLAEAGHLVVVVKQPLGIGFLAAGAFASTQSAYPDITRWVVGGHSLGGTVAAMEADAHDADASAPVVGLFFYASYPAGDLRDTLTSQVLSISASNDGLATPAKVDASKADLPRSARFVVVQGAVHAFFGDYGVQPGDGTPTISHDDARARISRATVDFVALLSAGDQAS